MRVLIAVALLMCGVAGAQQAPPITGQIECRVHVQRGPIYEWEWLPCIGETRLYVDGKWLNFTWLNEQPQAAKQEKAHPTPSSGAITTGTLPRCKDAKFGELCMTKDGWLQMNFPFDLPAKEWDGPDDDPRFINTRVLRHHVSCKDVAPDWKQRVLLDTADGKHHCYAFYLLEQKP